MEKEYEMIETKAVWRGDMSFDIELEGHTFIVDADEKVGGKDQGPRPKSLMMSSLAGCTGMDVVSILDKMQMPFDRFEIDIDGDPAEDHPKVFTDVRMIYRFWGDKLDEKKIRKAIDLSKNKYCAVSATLKYTGEVGYTVEMNP